MNGKRRILALCTTVLMFGTGQALGGEDGTARKTSSLMKAPYRDAKAIGVLSTGDKVDILETQGGWYLSLIHI